ncbi:MAG: class I SAM-dependent methyltransferase [Candidatus Thorarchaeota archaeon]
MTLSEANFLSLILSHPLRRPLYGFLKEIEASTLKKEILDCGAGGAMVPLALFKALGYKTHGLEISDHALNLARKFCEEREINFDDLDIRKGDMRNIPFEDNSLSFVYSLNTIAHLTKKDTMIAMKEIERIMKPNGLCFVNFASVDAPGCGQGRELNKGEWVMVLDDGEEVLHSFYEENEADSYFRNFEIIRKEMRAVSLPIDKGGWRGGGWQSADICYIAQKRSDR